MCWLVKLERNELHVCCKGLIGGDSLLVDKQKPFSHRAKFENPFLPTEFSVVGEQFREVMEVGRDQVMKAGKHVVELN